MTVLAETSLTIYTKPSPFALVVGIALPGKKNKVFCMEFLWFWAAGQHAIIKAARKKRRCAA
jgi:hypothetical protein